MIRLVTAGEPWPALPGCEAAVKLTGWRTAYGDDGRIVRFWTTEHGGLLGQMGDAVTASIPPEDLDEAAVFVTMQPTVRSLRADPAFAAAVAALRPAPVQTGAVTRLTSPAAAQPVDTPAPRDVYALLRQVFGDTLPAWEDWYVDVSHRLRHGCGRMVGVEAADGLAAVAMTTAESDSAALIGGVATRPDCRGRGYARRCVTALAAALQTEGKTVWLSPKNDYAKALYLDWGFVPAGEWAQIQWKD